MPQPKGVILESHPQPHANLEPFGIHLDIGGSSQDSSEGIKIIERPPPAPCLGGRGAVLPALEQSPASYQHRLGHRLQTGAARGIVRSPAVFYWACTI